MAPKKNRRPVNAIINIPQHVSQPVVSRTQRYYAGNALAAQQLTAKNMAASCGTICYVLNTTGTLLVSSIQLVRVRAWAMTPTSGTLSVVTVQFGTSSFGVNKEYTSETINAAEYAHLDVRPPKRSLDSMWHLSSNTDVLCVVTCPAGTVFDFTYNIVYSDNDPVTPTVSYTSGTAVLGNVYYMNMPQAVNTLQPSQLQVNY
jgi:hypothetical protein